MRCAEPVWEADGRAVGCCVTGLKRLPDGNVNVGQAERIGVRPGEILTQVGSVLVHDMSFDKVRT